MEENVKTAAIKWKAHKHVETCIREVDRDYGAGVGVETCLWKYSTCYIHRDKGRWYFS